ncbi:uncharacterized protein LOC141831080 [Curcuma longa]|uniref:uncharacterized protein LOC141831080 n=1 Tax=Curcuma longa TaxID=136217 RepID=UPI003D9F1BA3
MTVVSTVSSREGPPLRRGQRKGNPKPASPFIFHCFCGAISSSPIYPATATGDGIESWARGSQYLGQYRQGMRHGFGTYRFYEGDSYSGEWVGGQSHGCGVQSCSNDSFYAGEFKGGVMHGLGRYRFRNGDEYSGEYFGDKIHGFGVYKFANGHRYEGSWHEGRRQGFGTYTFWNGEARSGEWDNGTLRNRLQASDPAIKRDVEAARKLAEDAAKIPQMEEQVRKTVSAANKAAIVARVIAMRAVQNQKEGKFCDINVCVYKLNLAHFVRT